MKKNTLFCAGVGLLLSLGLTACGPLIGIYLLQGPEADKIFAPRPLTETRLPEEAPLNEASQDEQTQASRKALN